METLLEIVHEILKGIVCEIAAHVFQKMYLRTRKPPLAVASKRVVFVENKFT
ncbi:hypothetical protein [Pseudobacillus wudalianchiensis]|uniref:hypothetical protein n=1 Tax=Pseudobacillus wudalianchiensis TaxID=1743143 RepID=UPI00159F1A05|nr:hypothetical protein [Bacillus wudalianchiensis]